MKQQQQPVGIRIQLRYTIYGGDKLWLTASNDSHPILWNKNGLYGIVPLAMIQNMVNGDITMNTMSIHWHETTKVPANIAKLFLGENENEQCDYKTKSGTQSQ